MIIKIKCSKGGNNETNELYTFTRPIGAVEELLCPNQHFRIDCPMALQNLLAIMRMFWPDGCRYYTYDPRFATEDEARASIHAHMRDNLRRTLSDDKERADLKIAGTSRTTYADHRPLYMKPGVWFRLASYWVSEEFKKKSAAGKKAREAVKAPHTSGARSFDRRRRDYMEAHGGKLDELVVYKKCHTLKDEERKGEWITEEAKLIIVSVDIIPFYPVFSFVAGLLLCIYTSIGFLIHVSADTWYHTMPKGDHHPPSGPSHGSTPDPPPGPPTTRF
ncbi:hypothetical protein POM88_003070 [Heracleum sosnowskyi]|uniref:Uncharacterized protein n=1 Tax=Heracleum sosnowskyi TaxID=360622 RepID=A0AAD8JJV9_9APIA|nr:hypothetical protein POM88_003070 [Heracleum sosnowskyi]